jgi:hypothetical protein
MFHGHRSDFLKNPVAEFVPVSINYTLWRIELITCHGLPLRVFAITLTGHTVFGRTPRTSDQPDSEISTANKQYSQETNIHASTEIRTRKPRKRVVAEPCF